MGYRENQFYQLDSRLGNPTAGGGDNPPFMYPGNNRHRMDVIRGNQPVKRGFIKSLLDDSEIFKNLMGEDAAPSPYFSKRMFFQFNPSLITQNVQQTSGSLPLLQDPGQLTQPMIGDTNFSFEIMLDRQMEMNRNYRTSLIRDEPSYLDNTPPNSTGVSGSDPNIENSRDPGDIGVFADLKVLYSIIGQGLSSEQVEVYKSLLKRSSAKSTDDSESSADSATSTDVLDGVPFDSLDTNIGNSAFLAPLPIRIVFSSLFMVDGFVTSTQVLFTKFNANMVPVQARVGLSVQAVYIGFARPKTVFNAALTTAQEQVVETTPGNVQVGDEKDFSSLRALESKVLRNFRIALYANNTDEPEWDFSSKNLNPDKIADFVDIEKYKPWLTEHILGEGSSNSSSYVDGKIAVYCGFKDAPSNLDSDPIADYLKEGNSLSLQYDFTLRVLREVISGTDEVADYEGLLTLMTLKIDSGMAGVNGKNMPSPVATNIDEYNAMRRMKLRRTRAVTPTYYKSGGARGDRLFLTDTRFNKFVSENKKVTIDVDFTSKVELSSPSNGSTIKTYSNKYRTTLPIEKSAFEIVFPTSKRQVSSGIPSRNR